jgi:AcrR family transcriptional regulator
MAPVARVPRDVWIRQGLRALADGGPDAVRIDPLARALGVTRGGFYWHFADRSALLSAMLDAWERSTTTEVVGLVESGGGDAAAKLRRLLALTSPRVLQTDLAIRDWARRDEAVAARLRRVDDLRMEYLRSLFRGRCLDPGDVEARGMLAFSLLVGNHFIAASHGERSRADVLELALRQLMSEGTAPP